MHIIQIIRDSWGVIVLIATGIGSFIGAYLKWQSNKNKSTTLLYEELENLKKKIILQVPKEIEAAHTIAQQNFLLAELEKHCPDCYNKIKSKNNGTS